MTDEPYRNREIDFMFAEVQKDIKSLHSTIDTNRLASKEQLDRMESKQDFTNGKLRKIIVALVLAFGLIIGMGFEKFGPVLALILAA